MEVEPGCLGRGQVDVHLYEFVCPPLQCLAGDLHCGIEGVECVEHDCASRFDELAELSMRAIDKDCPRRVTMVPT
jgi:hypothetical protein